MPTEGLEPPWPDYKTGTLPIKWNRLNIKNSNKIILLKFIFFLKKYYNFKYNKI